MADSNHVQREGIEWYEPLGVHLDNGEDAKVYVARSECIVNRVELIAAVERLLQDREARDGRVGIDQALAIYAYEYREVLTSYPSLDAAHRSALEQVLKAISGPPETLSLEPLTTDARQKLFGAAKSEATLAMKRPSSSADSE